MSYYDTNEKNRSLAASMAMLDKLNRRTKLNSEYNHKPFTSPYEGVPESYAYGVYESPGQMARLADAMAGASLPGMVAGVFGHKPNMGEWVDEQTGVNEMGYNPDDYPGRLQQAARFGGNVVGDPLNAVPGGYIAGKFGKELGGEIIDQSLKPTMMKQGGMIGSVKAKNADIAALTKAQEMKAEGIDADTIYNETKWWLDHPDGKPRFEIDDSGAEVFDTGYTDLAIEATLNGDMGRARELMEAGANYTPPYRRPGTHDMNDVLGHSKLYDEYPDAGYIRQQTTNQHPLGEASYAPELDLISNSEMNTKSVKSPMMHELQHAIQQREGMARGGSPDQFTQLTPSTRQVLEMPIRNRLKSIAVEQQDGRFLTSGYTKGKESTLNNPEVIKLLNELEKINIDNSPFGKYQRLAGETEARLVQNRMDMPMSERLKAPFYKSYDVPLDEQIVRYGEGASLSRNGEKITQPGAHDKYSLESYNRSQVTGKKARNLKPGRIKDLRGEINDKRAIRRINKGAGDKLSRNNVRWRLDKYKSGKKQQSFIDKEMDDANAQYWSKDEVAAINKQLSYGMESSDHMYEKSKANLKASVRELKKKGWTLDHTSTHRGRVSSYYLKHGDNKIRLSDHNLPETAERVSNRAVGISGGWDDEVIIDGYTDIDEVLNSFDEVITQPLPMDNPTTVSWQDNYQDPLSELGEDGDLLWSDPYTLIELVSTPLEARGKGYAREALTDQLRAIAKAHPDNPVSLSATPLDKDTDADKLVEFYESLGFDVVDDGMGAAGVPMTMSVSDLAGYNKSLLNMDEASRMGRARAMGATDDISYHGTGADIHEFNNRLFGSSTGASTAEQGVWSVSEPSTARGYAEYAAKDAKVKKLIDEATALEKKGDWDGYDRKLIEAENLESEYARNDYGQGQNIMPLRTMGKFKEVDMGGSEFIDVDKEMKGIIKQAKSEGFDGVKFHNLADDVGFNARPATHTLTFDPKNIRSKFAKFDPAKKDSANLLDSRLLPIPAAGLGYSTLKDDDDYK